MLVNNVLRKYNEMKEKIESPKTSVYIYYKNNAKRIVSVMKNILQTKIQVSEKLNKID